MSAGWEPANDPTDGLDAARAGLDPAGDGRGAATDGLDPIVRDDAPRERPRAGQVVAVVPAKDEEARIGSTVAALHRLASVGWVVVVDDGSGDQTAAVAEWAGGVEVVRHERNRGKAAAMTSGARRAAELAPGAPVLFVDADLEASAANLGPVVTPVVVGAADMTIAVLPPQRRKGGGFGIVVRTATEGIRRLTGWTPTQPLSGQRCLTREALDAALPLAAGWGVEVGLTIDVIRSGGRVLEVPCELHHRVTGRDLGSQLHRAKQLTDVTRAIAERSGASEKLRESGQQGARVAREGAGRLSRRVREGGRPMLDRVRRRTAPYVEKAREQAGPYVEKAREQAAPYVDKVRGGWTTLDSVDRTDRGDAADALEATVVDGGTPDIGPAQDADRARDEHAQGERDGGDAGVVERPGEGHADEGGQRD